MGRLAAGARRPHGVAVLQSRTFLGALVIGIELKRDASPRFLVLVRAPVLGRLEILADGAARRPRRRLPGVLVGERLPPGGKPLLDGVEDVVAGLVRSLVLVAAADADDGRLVVVVSGDVPHAAARDEVMAGLFLPVLVLAGRL